MAMLGDQYDEHDDNNNGETNGIPPHTTIASLTAVSDSISNQTPSTNDGKVNSVSEPQSGGGEESEDLSDDEASQNDDGAISAKHEENMALTIADSGKIFEHEEDEEQEAKKHKPLSSLTVVNLLTSSPKLDRPTPESNGSSYSAAETPETTILSVAKKYKKKNNLWTKSARKGKKRQKNTTSGVADDGVFIDPVPKPQPDKTDDSEDMKICLSKVSKAERVELSEDRMEAGSNKGYRMVRATRGVVEGSWYFEIKVMYLGESGHTRLGWSTDKGDLQAPVGYDGYSFGYRDIDGSRIHNAVREKYGDEGYGEGDVIGFYISLPHGSSYAPRPPHFVLYKGQKYFSSPPDSMEDPPQTIPGSEISFFKNGVFQGVAFKDLYGGRYFPAASFYTLPKQPNCTVKFNFGPMFEFFPETFDGRPHPQPMSEVPYLSPDDKDENEVTGKC